MPVLFSDPLRNIFHYAVSIARQFNARMILLHVLQIHYATGLEADVADLGAPFDTDLRNNVEKHLTTLAREFIPGSILNQTQVRYGTPSTEIVSAAREVGADLIVMSAHSHTGRIHALFGSVSANVTRLAPCSVLVVRQPKKELSAGQPNPFKGGQNRPRFDVDPEI
jgi:nucleotide-binding universal stress UspA family protein